MTAAGLTKTSPLSLPLTKKIPADLGSSGIKYAFYTANLHPGLLCPSSLIQTVTVGSGITPDQPHMQVADSTAGRESHPAPKNVSDVSILPSGHLVKLFLGTKKQVMGIEPTYLAWKASVLPLNYTCTNKRYYKTG